MKKILLPVFILGGFVLGLSFGRIFDLITILGRNIPQEDLISDYSIATIWAFGLSIFLFFLPLRKTERPAIFWIWMGRCAVTLIFMLFYEHRYGLDAYNYFSRALQSQAPEYIFFKDSGTQFIMWLTWHINAFLPVFGSYHAIKVIYSFIGLLGVFLLYKAWTFHFERENKYWMYLIGFFPSILFWSSILGKEPIIFFAIGLYTYGVILMLKTGKLKYVAFIIAGIMFASTIRFWMSIIMVAPIGFVYIFRSRTGFIKKLIVTAAYLASFAYFGQVMFSRFQIETAEAFVEKSHAISRSWSKGGSRQEVPEFTSARDILVFAPKGMFTALFRPLPGEVNNIFGIIAGIENLLFLGFVLFSLINRQGFGKEKSITLWAMSYTLVWGLIYGIVSYQNLGAAVRFKLQVIPALLLAMVTLRERWTPKTVPAKTDRRGRVRQLPVEKESLPPSDESAV